MAAMLVFVVADGATDEPGTRLASKQIENLSTGSSLTVDAEDEESKYIFHHFNARFRGESCRWALAYAGVQWEDQRASLALFPTLGSTLPVLEVNGKNLTQSTAIARYIAKKRGFAGRGLWEQAEVDALIDYIVIDAIAGLRAYPEAALTGDKAKVTALKEQYTSVGVTPFLKELENKLRSNDGGQGFFFGPSATLADIIVVNFGDEVLRMKPDVLESYPVLREHRNRVHDLPGITEWIANRPDTLL
ncbi:putative Hematopoietic prostaglandin D synthase [Hypsibius exemplaris]|uniref:Hematopoietic prostaglandin D synthase n=1 Tax=Hypsibius exemplaris TaxID=2072580 RepID=A0A1W0XFC2_HYPEX|nr:putative Hematopoietic prostaglandin D synthase [Hypsibius exemplaris]